MCIITGIGLRVQRAGYSIITNATLKKLVFGGGYSTMSSRLFLRSAI